MPPLFYRLHLLPDLALLILTLAIAIQISRWVFALPAWRTWPRVLLVLCLDLMCASAAVSGYLLSFFRFQRLFHLPNVVDTWLGALGLLQAALLCGLFLGIYVWRKLPGYEAPRRAFLKTAGGALVAAPPLVLGAGFVTRNQFHVGEVRIAIPNLPKDLEGLRIVQITDIHLSSFLSEREFARAIDMANETRPHLALVTGDLITRDGDPLDACLRQLARLRAEAGALGCLGNHEIYTNTQDYVTEHGRRIGIDFLRKRARSLRFGNASINFAGVDYQQMGSHYLQGVEKLVQPGQVNVLLSHNPDVFPVAARQGFDLTIAGHTHGGQINLEILNHNYNVALYFTPYVRGLYGHGGASIYVSSGLGTIGVPVRLGAPAEVSLIQLCAS